MSRESEPSSRLRAEIWGATEEWGLPRLPSNDSCRKCDDESLTEYSLCQKCFAQLPDELCTAHVVNALGP